MKEPITREQLREFALGDNFIAQLALVLSPSIVAQHLAICSQVYESAEQLRHARRLALKEPGARHPSHKKFHMLTALAAAQAEMAFDAALDLMHAMITLSESCDCEQCVEVRLREQVEEQRENFRWQ